MIYKVLTALGFTGSAIFGILNNKILLVIIQIYYLTIAKVVKKKKRERERENKLLFFSINC